MEIVKVGRRRTSSEYYQLIRHQCGRVPEAQNDCWSWKQTTLRSSLCRHLEKQKQTQSEAAVCPPPRWAGTRAGTLGYRCTEHCYRTSPQSCCSGERHQRRKALSYKRLQNDTPILEYSPLPETHTVSFFWVAKMTLQMCSKPTVTIFQFQVRVSRM